MIHGARGRWWRRISSSKSRAGRDGTKNSAPFFAGKWLIQESLPGGTLGCPALRVPRGSDIRDVKEQGRCLPMSGRAPPDLFVACEVRLSGVGFRVSER